MGADSGLGGKVALVTGGGAGVGRAVVRALAAEGAALVVADDDADAGTSAAEYVASAGVDAIFTETDVTDDAAVAAAVDAAIDTFGRLDVAVNTAAVSASGDAVHETDLDRWGHVVDVNLVGVARSMHHELRQMRAQDGPSAVVNVASVLGKVGFAGASAYVAAAHGVLGLTRAAALEYAADDVRVNAVCPGFLTAESVGQAGLADERREAVEEMHPAGRFGRADEVADAVVWLAGDRSTFVTGEAVDVDGGYLAR